MEEKEEYITKWAYDRWKPGFKMVTADAITRFIEEHNIDFEIPMMDKD